MLPNRRLKEVGMIGASGGPVVVGIDGSPASRAAVDFAATQAHRRRLPLLLVHGYQPSVTYGPSVVIAYDGATHLQDAWTMLRAEPARVHRRYPDLRISTAVTIGDPGHVLVDESHLAAFVVVGAHGLGNFDGTSLGSVSGWAATHAGAPVVVVRPPAADHVTRPRFGVAVGIDGSPGSAAAVGFAYDLAATCGTDLTAVYAYAAPPTEWYADPVEARQEADLMLAEALAGWQERYPEVEVVRRAVHTSNPLGTFIEEAADAELIVLGARGRGGSWRYSPVRRGSKVLTG
jgi:nucleotide-binding universal stress UspA family protein